MRNVSRITTLRAPSGLTLLMRGRHRTIRRGGTIADPVGDQPHDRPQQGEVDRRGEHDRRRGEVTRARSRPISSAPASATTCARGELHHRRRCSTPGRAGSCAPPAAEPRRRAPAQGRQCRSSARIPLRRRRSRCPSAVDLGRSSSTCERGRDGDRRQRRHRTPATRQPGRDEIAAQAAIAAEESIAAHRRPAHGARRATERTSATASTPISRRDDAEADHGRSARGPRG